MKIPKKIKVGGHIYKVIYPYRFKEREDLYGRTNEGRKEIFVTNLDANGNKLPQTKIEETFLHELLHAVDQTYNNNDLKEEIVARMGEGLYQVLKDNKLLKE
ncbi:hypothetical protein MYX07_00310 [Patescibacteria group bacterium AH-259-L07]|nr:hypothetical protein [Patescibacteria group bacterium AH-259-L07]